LIDVVDLSYWFCANGLQYGLSPDVEITCFDSDNVGPRPEDPLPTANHMSLIANVNGTLYDAGESGTFITVPGGVTDGLMGFQLNDESIVDNQGTITFFVTVCNPEDPDNFTHVFDADGLSAWSVFGGTNASYSAGNGWVPGNSGTNRGIGAQIGFTERTLTNVTIKWTGTPGGADHYPTIWVVLGGVVQERVDGPDWSAGSNSFSWSGEIDADAVWVAVLCSDDATFTGDALLFEVDISGHGTDPF